MSFCFSKLTLYHWLFFFSPSLSFQFLYVSVLVMCYVVYFVMFLGSPEATKKSFPVARMKALLPNLLEDEVGCTVS